MEIQIIEEINNNLLNRREVVFKATYENATPSRKSIIDKLSAIMNSKQGLVIIDNMKTEFGKRESIGYAKIYESPERVKEIERTHIIERNVATTAQIDNQKTSEQSETK